MIFHYRPCILQKNFGTEMRKNISALSNESLKEMTLREWPGKIRELEHVIE